MVHSYINSKMTITSLPGPYHDSLRSLPPKHFTLQINLSLNQEAGVHLKRTLPPPHSSLPPRGGILKNGPNNYRNKKSATQQQTPGGVAGLKKKPSQGTAAQAKQTMRDLEEDSSSSLSDEGPSSSRRGRHGAHSNSGAGRGTQQPSPHTHSGGPVGGGGSIETLSLHVPSQASQASDLYDFVGLSQQSQHSQQQQQQGQGQGQQPQYAESKRSGGGAGGGGGGGRSSSAEERLHNILGDLQRGGGDRGNNGNGGGGGGSGKNTKGQTVAEAKRYSRPVPALPP
jgi:hypothetical protein